MNGNIVLMMHIPEFAPDCQLEMLRQMKHLLDICSSNLKKQFESWELNFDDAACTGVTYSYEVCSNQWYRIGCNLIEKEPCAIVSVVSSGYCSNSQSLQMLGIGATLISHAKHVRLPQNYGERLIRMDIPAELWKHINVQALTRAITEACMVLKASYACMDIGGPVGGMYEGWFRLLSGSPIDVDIESRLPGVYWWQLVSATHVAATGKFHEITNQSRSIMMEIVNNADNDMLVIQLSDDLMCDSRNQRLAMRDYFKNSLYDISVDTLNLAYLTGFQKWSLLNSTQKEDVIQRMQRIPLTDEEIKHIKSRLQVEE